MKKETIEAMDLMLEELLILQREVKDKQAKIDQIKAWCKEQGSFMTDKFVCTISPQCRVGIAPLDEVAEVIGRGTLEAFNLIRTTEYKVVNVSQRPDSLKTKLQAL